MRGGLCGKRTPLFVFIYSLVCIPLLLYGSSELSCVVNYRSGFFLYHSSSLAFFSPQKFSQRKHDVEFLVLYPWASLCVSPSLFIYISRERLAEKRKHEGFPTNHDQPQFLCVKNPASHAAKSGHVTQAEIQGQWATPPFPLLWAWFAHQERTCQSMLSLNPSTLTFHLSLSFNFSCRLYSDLQQGRQREERGSCCASLPL